MSELGGFNLKDKVPGIKYFPKWGVALGVIGAIIIVILKMGFLGGGAELPLSLIFLVLVLVIFAISSLWKSRLWVETPGTILQFDVNRLGLSEGFGKIKKYDYEINVRYRYSVDGKTYEGDKMFPSGLPQIIRSSATSFSLDDSMKDYAVGKDVKVYYNLKKPEEAALITLGAASASGQKPTNKKMIFFIVVISAVAVVAAMMIAGALFLMKNMGV